MLRPVIMIGCGGSGQMAVRYVRDAVQRRLEHSGWEEGVPKSWRFIGLDTLEVQQSPGEIPVLPADDYLSVSMKFPQFSGLTDALLARHSPQDPDSGYHELVGWRPNPAEVVVPMLSGAGKMRAVGRIAGVLGLDRVVRQKIINTFSECDAGGPQLQKVSQHLKLPVPPGTAVPDPLIVVIGSMAGGTGAGILLDVVDLIRRTDKRGAYPTALIFTPDIFGAIHDDAMAANGLAMMSELMSAYWDNEASYTKLIPANVVVEQRGPHSTFLIGRKNLRGIDLGNHLNVYRAVGEALGSWVYAYDVQEVISQFIIGNWPMDAPANMGGYPFDPGYQPGVVSSFGSASISIGRDRFREYTKKLIMREVLDGLYAGYKKKGRAELGDDSKHMSDTALVNAMVSRHFKEYLTRCHLDERGTHANQITDRFASADIAKEERKEIEKQLRQQFVNKSATPQKWFSMLSAQARQVQRPSADRATKGFDEIVKDWGPETLRRILEVSSDYVSRYGLTIGELLVGKAVNEVTQVSAEVHQESEKDRSNRDNYLAEAESTLLRNAGTDSAINYGNDLVQSAIGHFAKAILASWRADRRQAAAKAMGSLSSEVLTTVMALIAQAHSQVHALVTGVDGDDSLVEGWPKYREGPPEGFQPSPLEFFLEEVEDWEEKVDELAGEATEEAEKRDYPSTDPIDAIRYLVNMGGFPDSQHHEVSPILWSESATPQWRPGAPARIAVSCGEEQIDSRVTAWMNKPNSAMLYHFEEGLGEYLRSTDRDGKPIPDHTNRLRTFRQKLNEAKNQSAPLVELDQRLNAVIHPNDTEVVPVVEAFPFTIAHPAREIVDGVMGAGKAKFDTDHDPESVLLSSYIRYPFHPMIVSSFVQPVQAALTAIGNEAARLRGGFWLFRRTKTLEDFIPLPDHTRLTIIRGFAVARMLGYVTADPKRPVTITGTNGPIRFPFPLLTEVSQSNILPALLEAFVTCFGKVPTEQVAAFAAYERLYLLGFAEGEGYTLHDEGKTFLKEGTLPFAPEDQARYENAAAETEEERNANLQKYLEDNIGRFEKLRARPLTGQEVRNMVGTVTPEDSMTIELAEDFIRGYNEVLDALGTAVGSIV